MKNNPIFSCLRYMALVISLPSCDAVFKVNSSESSQRRDPTPSELPSADTEGDLSSLKLGNPECIDPDLSKVATGEKLMLCDGSIGVGTYAVASCNSSLRSNCFASDEHIVLAVTEVDASKIVAGTTFGTVAGTATPAPPECTTANEQGCVVSESSDFLAIDPTQIDPFDIRAGRAVGGVTGRLKQCKSGINKDRWNLETPNDGATPDAFVSYDYFDSIEDKNDTTGAQVLGGILAETAFDADRFLCAGEEWRVLAPASNNSETIAGDSTYCDDAADECMIQDQLTGIVWSKVNPDGGAATDTWAGAITRCEALDFGGYDDWRMPTLKETLQAVIDNIFALHFHNTEFGPYAPLSYWTATTHSSDLDRGYSVWIDDGDANIGLKTVAHSFHCMREI